jgi:GT2 family glycosyltransferase
MSKQASVDGEMPVEPVAGDNVAIVIPMLNEAAVIPRLLRLLAVLAPAPAEIIAVDGGSLDETVALVRDSGFVRAVVHPVRGRAAAINRGVEEACSPLVCVLHADTILPDDAVTVIRRTLANPGTALAGFTPLIAGPETVRWGTTFHNWIKTWYAPLIFRPHLFLRGGRLLFGDQAMFFRRADFLAVGGCDETLTIMEDADLCLRLFSRGRIRLVNRVVMTSDRRVAAWGGFRANLIYLYIGIRWGLGLRRHTERHYPHIR